MLLPCTFLLLVINQAACETLRLLGGQVADVDKYPYIGRYERYNKVNMYYGRLYILLTMCNACIIKPTWTLSAGHCTYGFIRRRWPSRNGIGRGMRFAMYEHENATKRITRGYFKQVIAISGHDMSSREEYSILRVVEFPSKRDTHLTFEDILLIETVSIQLEIYGKLSAIDFPALSGQEALMIGSGMNEDHIKDGMTYPDLKLTPVLMKRCDGDQYGIYPTICTVHACGKFSTLCSADAGGPLLHLSGIVGIASRIEWYQCSRAGLKYGGKKAGYFTPVSLFIDWISVVTGAQD